MLERVLLVYISSAWLSWACVTLTMPMQVVIELLAKRLRIVQQFQSWKVDRGSLSQVLSFLNTSHISLEQRKGIVADLVLVLLRQL